MNEYAPFYKTTRFDIFHRRVVRNPGESVDHGLDEISLREHCWGRGYLLPNN